MRILGIETSCDETAAAIVEDGRHVVSNVIASQVRVHGRYRGVVPEIASRCHIEYILPVVSEALEQAALPETGEGIDAVAVTRGPGLVGALLVGVETAKTLAWSWGKPLIAVHHSLGHLHSVFCELASLESRVFEIPPENLDDENADVPCHDSANLGANPHRGPLPEDQGGRKRSHYDSLPLPLGEGRGEGPSFTAEQMSHDTDIHTAETAGATTFSPEPRPQSVTPAPLSYPYLGLVVSGGHCNIVRVDAPGRVRTLGSTLDDAPGEAYDKVAKCLNLPYPGGPPIDSNAARGNPTAFDLPRPILHAHGYDFSFSGLKTAVVRLIEDLGGLERVLNDETLVCDICASFQAAVIDVLLTKTERALRDERLRGLAVVGGVACNRGLRAEAARRFRRTRLVFPPPILCTDNAAMIAAIAHYLDPLSTDEALRLDARAGWKLP